MKNVPETQADTDVDGRRDARKRDEARSGYGIQDRQAVADCAHAGLDMQSIRTAAVARFRRCRNEWSRVPLSLESVLAARHEGHRF